MQQVSYGGELFRIQQGVVTVPPDNGSPSSAGGSGGVSAAMPSSDAGPAWTAVHGVAGTPFVSADQSGAKANVTDVPVTGQKLVITDLEISVDTDMAVTFYEESNATPIAGPFYMAAKSSFNALTHSKRKLVTANKRLQVQTSVLGNIMVNALYYSET